MLTVTRELVLPTTVTGSWPRPRWYGAQLAGRPLSTCLKDVGFREQFTDALAAVVDDQERAGLDIVTHGDYHHDDSVGGHHWLRYPLERWAGLAGDYGKDGLDLPRFAPGRILNEVLASARWPRVTGEVRPNESNPLEYAKIWRLTQARSTKPVMFGTVSSQQFSLFLGEENDVYGDDRRALIWDMAEAMNFELRQVAAAGCRVIQVEEPLLHFVACFHPEKTEMLDFLVDAFNREVEGLEDVEVWVHTCWGNPNMQRGAEGKTSYANAVELYLERVNADVWTIEASSDGAEVLDFLRPHRETMRKKIALGVVSHRTLQVETPEEVAALTHRALRSIALENLVLTSDCGFGRQGANRLIALYKAAAISQGANIVRRDLGLEARYVPLADPALQPDTALDAGEARLFGGLV